MRKAIIGVAALLLVGCGPESDVTAPIAEATPAAMFPAQVEAANAALDEFMSAFNSRDPAAYEATFNFPSVRLASGELVVLEAGDVTEATFERLVASGWDHSAWVHRIPIHAGEDKVHFDTRFARYRADGSLLSEFDSLYVVTLEDGRWGVKIRSSFAP
jgi:hypothetical protein